MSHTNVVGPPFRWFRSHYRVGLEPIAHILMFSKAQLATGCNVVILNVPQGSSPHPNLSCLIFHRCRLLCQDALHRSEPTCSRDLSVRLLLLLVLFTLSFSRLTNMNAPLWVLINPFALISGNVVSSTFTSTTPQTVGLESPSCFIPKYLRTQL
jgi:hypothetical protein